MDARTHGNDATRRLARATGAVVDPRRPLLECIAEVQSMVRSVREVATFSGDLRNDIGRGETRTGSGQVVSPSQAAMCGDDVLRTGAFVRGLHAAVTDAMATRCDRKVRVRYAGCGPYALLAVPPMTLLDPERVAFRLLDLHSASIDSARSVVTGLGLECYVSGFEVADACRYVIPPDEVPDVIVSETMKAGLHGEPQVAIFRNLLAQAPAAVLVPRSVRVDVLAVDPSREFSLLRPGGIVFVEEVDTHTMQCTPANADWDEALALMRNAFRAIGADTTLGLRLRRLFLERGCTDVRVRPCVHA